MTQTIRADAGVAFEDGADRGRIFVFGHQTGGRYSLMDYIVAPRAQVGELTAADFGPHRHDAIEETFLVRRGRLTFLLGDQVIDMAEGDFVRVPPGARHGFANLSGEPVELLVSFHPGGFEDLFLRHRTDQHPPPDPDGFMRDAMAEFGSEFE